jgi:hypothetical protein
MIAEGGNVMFIGRITMGAVSCVHGDDWRKPSNSFMGELYLFPSKISQDLLQILSCKPSRYIQL